MPNKRKFSVLPEWDGSKANLTNSRKFLGSETRECPGCNLVLSVERFVKRYGNRFVRTKVCDDCVVRSIQRLDRKKQLSKGVIAKGIIAVEARRKKIHGKSISDGMFGKNK